MLARLFKPRVATERGRVLYTALTQQARRPEFYAELGAPDTHEGRFELYVLHLALILRRLRGCGPEAAETSQALFDQFVSALDDGLREMGVGDLSVGRKMRKLAEAFFGRLKSYDEALEEGELDAVIGRTVYAGAADADPAPLADYMRRADVALAESDTDAVMKGELRWPLIR